MFSWIQNTSSFAAALRISFISLFLKFFFWTLHRFSCISEVQVVRDLLFSPAHNFGIKFSFIWNRCMKAVSGNPMLGFLFIYIFFIFIFAQVIQAFSKFSKFVLASLPLPNAFSAVPVIPYGGGNENFWSL